jgi:hypothetical protein
VKVNGFEVPPSVVTVTGADGVVPDGTATRQLVGSGQAMRATCPPKEALIWPDGLSRLVPVITTICPGAPLDGSRADRTGPLLDGGGVEVVVGTGTTPGELVGGGVVAGGLVAGGLVTGGLVAGELGGELVAGLLRGRDAEVEWAVGVPPPLIDDKLTRATTAATRATDMMRTDRLSQRPRPAAAGPPSGEVPGPSAAGSVGGGADRPSTPVRRGSPPASGWRERRAASAMAASARASRSWSEW